MMDELISEVCTKTGLSQDQARSAVNAVIGVLKTRLPAPLASCLDGVAGGSASVVADGGGVETSENRSGGIANEATALLGNLFGNKR